MNLLFIYCRTIVVILRSILPMVVVMCGGSSRCAGSMKMHVRKDHSGFLQEHHHNFVSSVRRPYIRTFLEVQNDGRFLARKRKRSRAAIPG